MQVLLFEATIIRNLQLRNFQKMRSTPKNSKSSNQKPLVIANPAFNLVKTNQTKKSSKKPKNHFKKYKKTIKIKYEKSKFINQYSYRVSNKKFTENALLLKSDIHHDIKSTLKMFRNINNEM